MRVKERSDTRRRRIVVVSLLGAVLTVVALAMFSWPRLQSGYHLWQLRRQPGLVESWLLAGKADSLKRQALTRFFRERQGQEVLFGLYLREYDRRQYDPTTVVEILSRLPTRGDGADNGVLFLAERNFGFMVMKGRLARQSYSMINVPTNVELRRAILWHMHACVGRTFRVPDLPRYEFHVQAIVDGESEPPPWRSDEGRSGRFKNSKARYVCYFRLVDEA